MATRLGGDSIASGGGKGGGGGRGWPCGAGYREAVPSRTGGELSTMIKGMPHSLAMNLINLRDEDAKESPRHISAKASRPDCRGLGTGTSDMLARWMAEEARTA